MSVVVFGDEFKAREVIQELRDQGVRTFARTEPSLSLVKIVRPDTVILAGEGASFDAFAWALRRWEDPPRLIRLGDGPLPLALSP